MVLANQLIHQRYIFPDPCVQGSRFLNTSTLTVDRDRTDLRRTKPNSCSALPGEQPDPWKLLHLQDAKSRHRGVNPRRR